MYLNNLYGSTASNTNSSFKVADVKGDKLDMDYKGFRYSGRELSVDEETYIKNDVLLLKELEIMFKTGFNYADTDSIHCDLPPEMHSNTF